MVPSCRFAIPERFLSSMDAPFLVRQKKHIRQTNQPSAAAEPPPRPAVRSRGPSFKGEEGPTLQPGRTIRQVGPGVHATQENHLAHSAAAPYVHASPRRGQSAIATDADRRRRRGSSAPARRARGRWAGVPHVTCRARRLHPPRRAAF